MVRRAAFGGGEAGRMLCGAPRFNHLVYSEKKGVVENYSDLIVRFNFKQLLGLNSTDCENQSVCIAYFLISAYSLTFSVKYATNIQTNFSCSLM